MFWGPVSGFQLMLNGPCHVVHHVVVNDAVGREVEVDAVLALALQVVDQVVVDADVLMVRAQRVDGGRVE
jgi:NAD(P)H-hydrate repair Nnr-like enzyme with NAD(P)H-hydrate dehydratase domain